MTEIGIAEYFSMAEALGIIATLFVILYFSRKQMQDSGQWGDFKTFMRFHVENDTITKLEVGQTE
ncbi:MAG TPA: hypothetical protein VFJ51_11585 [Nitrososphaeraceae archaeon]|nr:hypothetical protein [Nitrososphaeraceae archaeon]